MDWYEIPPAEAEVQLRTWAAHCDLSLCQVAEALVHGIFLGKSSGCSGAVLRQLEQLLRELPITRLRERDNVVEADWSGYPETMKDEELIEAAQRLSKSLTPGDLDHTLRRITAAAVEVLPEVEYASITVKHGDGRLETAAPTDDRLWGVDAAQYELREGPCYAAAVDSVHVLSPDLAADPRFPKYAATATAVGIRAQAGLRLFDAPSSQGALNLYSTTVGSFEDIGSVGRLFAHQSAVAIGYAHEIHNLQEALRTRRTIGQAIGILMERYSLTDQRAFAFLTRLSQHGNVKLNRVAEQFVSEAENKNERGRASGAS